MRELEETIRVYANQIQVLALRNSELEDQARDGWTIRSADGSRTAHSEHTVAITEDGPLVLTRRLPSHADLALALASAEGPEPQLACHRSYRTRTPNARPSA